MASTGAIALMPCDDEFERLKVAREYHHALRRNQEVANLDIGVRRHLRDYQLISRPKFLLRNAGAFAAPTEAGLFDAVHWRTSIPVDEGRGNTGPRLSSSLLAVWSANRRRWRSVALLAHTVQFDKGSVILMVFVAISPAVT